MIDDALVIIPARGGSKGIPGKNIKPLGGKPLIAYSIEIALAVTYKEHICVSTDDAEIAAVAKSCGVDIPFTRPAELSTDEAGSQEVLLHAVDHYKTAGLNFDRVILLQPTSPFRTAKHVEEANSLYKLDCDMVVSVFESDANPYYNLFEKDGDVLRKSKPGNYTRRQDCPPVYQLNGSIYVINPESLANKKMSEFEQVLPYEMPSKYSIDLDTMADWEVAEYYLEKELI